MKNKIIRAIRLTEATLNETEVAYDGDYVVIIKNNGEEERFKPVGLTAAEVVEKFFAIKKHSEGRAWQWLRKVEREEERQAEIEDESTITEAVVSKEEIEKCLSSIEPYDTDEGYSISFEVSEENDGVHITSVTYDTDEDDEYMGDMDSFSDYWSNYSYDIEQELSKAGYKFKSNNGEIIVSKGISESTITEEEDSTTECPYHNLLADLLNKENVTVQDYEAAIIKFNEAPDIPEEKKVRIIEILNHIKDEELEHVNELQLADKILKGEDEEPAPEGEVAVTDVVATETPDEVEVTVDSEEETFESIKEAILPDDEVFKLLKGKSFKDYDEVEAALTKEGFEVVEVFKEGDGFNVNLRKEGVEYFVPFCACEGKFCAVIEQPDERPLEEGLGDWIAAKVAKVVGKGQGINAKEKLIKDLQAKLGDAVKVSADDKNIKILPSGDEGIVTIGYKVDADGLHLDKLKAISLKPEELAATVKDAIGQVDEPAPEEPETSEEGDDEVARYIEQLKAAGIDDEADLKKYVLKKFPDYKGEIK